MDEIRYARAGDTHVAYEVIDGEGDGTLDVVMVAGALFPIELYHEDHLMMRLVGGLASLGRLAVFDKRGIGLSDPITDWDRPLFEQWADDLAAVIEDAGLQRPHVFAWDGAGVARRLAAESPELISGITVFSPVDLPADEMAEWRKETGERTQDMVEGRLDFQAVVIPSRSRDREFREWTERSGRAGASPSTATRIWAALFGQTGGPEDRGSFRKIGVPTLVLHRPANLMVSAAAGPYSASMIPGAQVVALEGEDFFPIGGDIDAIIAEVAGFATGEAKAAPPERLLAAVLFTDLVSSTERAAEMGDAAWRGVLDRHDEIARRCVGRRGGTVVKGTGDGVLATLPSATGALEAARDIRSALAGEGLGIRAGVHVGEIERRGNDVAGIGVHVAARVMAQAPDGEIYVTAAVPISVAGTDAAFEPVGETELRGVPGSWALSRVLAS